MRPWIAAEAKRQLGLSAEKRYVLFPAAPSRVEKRYELARAGFDRFCAATPPRNDVELIALDNVPHERVPLFMNASEAVLMTSSFEASPVTIREALACNVPVISTDVGDARVVMKDIAGCRIVEADPERDRRGAARVALGAAPRASRASACTPTRWKPWRRRSLRSTAA